MSLMVDIMHLTVIVTGLGIAVWALAALRNRLPRGRFLVFGIASAGALFGCAALAGEVGIVSPPVWFAIVMSAMLGTLVVTIRANSPTPHPA